DAHLLGFAGRRGDAVIHAFGGRPSDEPAGDDWRAESDRTGLVAGWAVDCLYVADAGVHDLHCGWEGRHGHSAGWRGGSVMGAELASTDFLPWKGPREEFVFA